MFKRVLEGSDVCLIEAVLTGTHKLCFIAEIRNIIYTPVNPILFIKVAFDGVKDYIFCEGFVNVLYV